MTRTGNVLMAVVVGLGLAAPAGTRAATPVAMTKADHPMACSIVVNYSLNNVVRLSYVKDFEVDPETPFSDDFSTATRFKFFDAWMTRESGVAVVSVSFFSDVSVFNSIDFGTSLKVKDETNGETTSGTHTFFAGGAAPGTHNTTYNLTCQRAKD